MSYDLGLYARAGASPLERQAISEHFTGEQWEQDENDFHYTNQDTGVYFHFTWYEGGEEDEEDPNRLTRPHLAFNMNYFRPHFFALEAEPILARVVERFDLVVDDPQSEGMGQGEYSSEGFLRGWNAGNRFAAQAFRQLGANQNALSLPTVVNRRLWSWNFQRESIGEDFADLDGIDVYVPPIWFCRENEQVRTFCLFPNLVPTAIPQVDHVMILRNELPSPYKKKSKKTPAWVRWSELRAIAADFEIHNEDDDNEENDLPSLVLYNDDYQNPETAPSALASWVIGLPGWPGKPEQITPDQILDAELLAAEAEEES